nr:MAG TPA: hypothetical protein [Caudoviricetes sp.]
MGDKKQENRDLRSFTQEARQSRSRAIDTGKPCW